MTMKRFAALGLMLSFSVHADPLTNAQQQITRTDTQGQAHQAQIDRLDDQTQQLLNEYRQVRAEVDQLTLYNKQMTAIVNHQEQELESLARQIVDIERTERGILPLMHRMVDSLEQFVELDVPFSLQEREARVALLKDLLTRADVTVAEKFRRVMEGYQIEVDFGRNIEAYRAQQNNVSYDFLRIGRVALYRLSNDGQQAWLWHPMKNDWLALDSGYLRSIRQAFKVANQTVAPEILHLPMPTPHSMQAEGDRS